MRTEFDAVIGAAEAVHHTTRVSGSPASRLNHVHGTVVTTFFTTLRIHHTAVQIASNRPHHLGDGDELVVVGHYGDDGVLHAVAFENQTLDVRHISDDLRDGKLKWIVAALAALALGIALTWILGRAAGAATLFALWSALGPVVAVSLWRSRVAGRRASLVRSILESPTGSVYSPFVSSPVSATPSSLGPRRRMMRP